MPLPMSPPPSTAHWLVMPQAIAALTDRLGRKLVIGSGTALSGAACLACMFTSAGPMQVGERCSRCLAAVCAYMRLCMCVAVCALYADVQSCMYACAVCLCASAWRVRAWEKAQGVGW